jgi:hypothetical protein
MRASVRPFLVLTVMCGFTAISRSEIGQPVPGGGVNILEFQKGLPTPTNGGVDVSVTQRPTAGYTCTKMTIRVIDNASGQTIGTYVVDNPGGVVTKSFTGLGNSKEIQVTANATFQNGTMFDTKSIEAVVTTK